MLELFFTGLIHLDMDSITTISTILSIVCLSLFFILLRKSIKLQIDIRIVLVTILLMAVGNYIVITSSNEIFFLGQMMLNFGFLIFFFHYEAIAFGSPNKKYMVILCSLYTGSSMINVLGILYLQTPAADALPTLTLTSLMSQTDFLFGLSMNIGVYLTTIMILIVFGRAISIINRIHQQAKARATRIELIALIILFAYRAIFLLRGIIAAEQFIPISTIALGLSIIGLLLLISNYVFNPDYIYLLPFPIHTIMIYNKSGVLCYTRQFKNDPMTVDNAGILMSGAFTAISSLIQETLGLQAKIRHINAVQYQIFFNRLPRDAGHLVVISYGETAFFHKSLQRFARKIDASLLEEIKEISDMTSLEPKIDVLIRQAFPYLRF